MTWDTNPGFTSNKPKHYLVGNGGFIQSYLRARKSPVLRNVSDLCIPQLNSKRDALSCFLHNFSIFSCSYDPPDGRVINHKGMGHHVPKKQILRLQFHYICRSILTMKPSLQTFSKNHNLPSLQTFSKNYNLPAPTNYVVCVNFIHE